MYFFIYIYTHINVNIRRCVCACVHVSLCVCVSVCINLFLLIVSAKITHLPTLSPSFARMCVAPAHINNVMMLVDTFGDWSYLCIITEKG